MGYEEVREALKIYPDFVESLTDDDIRQGLAIGNAGTASIAAKILIARMASAHRRVMDYDGYAFTDPAMRKYLKRVLDSEMTMLHDRARFRGTSFKEEKAQLAKQYETAFPGTSYDEVWSVLAYNSVVGDFSVPAPVVTSLPFPTAAVAASAVGLLLLGAGGIALARRRSSKTKRAYR